MVKSKRFFKFVKSLKRDNSDSRNVYGILRVVKKRIDQLFIENPMAALRLSSGLGRLSKNPVIASVFRCQFENLIENAQFTSKDLDEVFNLLAKQLRPYTAADKRKYFQTPNDALNMAVTVSRTSIKLALNQGMTPKEGVERLEKSYKTITRKTVIRNGVTFDDERSAVSSDTIIRIVA
jgi:hypothetical protein